MRPRWLILLSLLVLLQACGFQLRGLASLPDHLSNLQLLTGNLTTNQQRTLSQRLEKAGATLHHDDAENVLKLRVSIKSLPERKLADSAGSGQNIVRLSRRLSFSLIEASGNRLASNKTIEQNIDLELDEANLLGTEGEKQQALDNLDTALFNSLMIQLRRL
jgi:LPS-assembly lipoprotein